MEQYRPYSIRDFGGSSSVARTFHFDDYTQAIAFLRNTSARTTVRFALEYGGEGQTHQCVVSARDDAADLMGILALGRSSQGSGGELSPDLILRELAPCSV